VQDEWIGDVTTRRRCP